MSRLATIPHAPIERVNHRTGEVENLAVGSFVNVAAAEGIYARAHTPSSEGPSPGHYKPAIPAAVVVQLPLYDWVFIIDDDEKAIEWADKMTMIALKR